MTEKQIFSNNWRREFDITLKILRQFPADKVNFRPAADKARSAKELATVFVTDLDVAAGLLKGKVDFSAAPLSFATYGDLLTAVETKNKDMASLVLAMTEEDWNRKITVPVGPKQMGEVRCADMFWTVLNDSIHHRGQFSVYLRLVGAKVPSIYGPSGDEPWM